MRKETTSLAFGRDGFGAGISAGFVVAALNMASAACRGSVDLRGLSTFILITSFRAHSASWNRHAFTIHALAHILSETTQIGCFRFAHFTELISDRPDISVHCSGICTRGADSTFATPQPRVRGDRTTSAPRFDAASNGSGGVWRI